MQIICETPPCEPSSNPALKICLLSNTAAITDQPYGDISIALPADIDQHSLACRLVDRTDQLSVLFNSIHNHIWELSRSGNPDDAQRCARLIALFEAQIRLANIPPLLGEAMEIEQRGLHVCAETDALDFVGLDDDVVVALLYNHERHIVWFERKSLRVLDNYSEECLIFQLPNDVDVNSLSQQLLTTDSAIHQAFSVLHKAWLQADNSSSTAADQIELEVRAMLRHAPTFGQPSPGSSSIGPTI